jgi:hypothetical protein
LASLVSDARGADLIPPTAISAGPTGKQSFTSTPPRFLRPTAEPGVAGRDDRLRPRRRADLGEDEGHVVAHRLLAEEQGARRGAVVEPGGDPIEDVELAIGELGERAWC